MGGDNSFRGNSSAIFEIYERRYRDLDVFRGCIRADPSPFPFHILLLFQRTKESEGSICSVEDTIRYRRRMVPWGETRRSEAGFQTSTIPTPSITDQYASNSGPPANACEDFFFGNSPPSDSNPPC